MILAWYHWHPHELAAYLWGVVSGVILGGSSAYQIGRYLRHRSSQLGRPS